MQFGQSSEAVIFADPTHLTSIGITKHAIFDDPNRMTFISAIEFLKDHVLYKKNWTQNMLLNNYHLSL